VGIDIQSGMIERLKVRVDRAGVTNLQAILGDATQPHVPEASFDLVFLCDALGEIPDRAAALNQCHRALKPGGVLSITELFGDPHYQFRSVVQRLAEAAGFRLQSIKGKWWFYTASFLKP
jgi:ubiquinone/menaquinone biosynthesis C-methylase UbiE